MDAKEFHEVRDASTPRPSSGEQPAAPSLKETKEGNRSTSPIPTDTGQVDGANEGEHAVKKAGGGSTDEEPATSIAQPAEVVFQQDGRTEGVPADGSDDAPGGNVLRPDTSQLTLVSPSP